MIDFSKPPSTTPVQIEGHAISPRDAVHWNYYPDEDLLAGLKDAKSDDGKTIAANEVVIRDVRKKIAAGKIPREAEQILEIAEEMTKRQLRK